MSFRLPPLNPLRAFEATARLGSVTLAARELFVGHSAVSHQLRTLEEAMNMTLLVKGSRPLKLTPQGAVLFAAVSGAFENIAAVTQQLTRPTTQGRLTVACVPALLSFWLLPKLHRFMSRYPDIHFTIIPSNDETNLDNAKVDVCVIYGDGNWEPHWVKLWSQLEFFPVASPSLLNAQPLRSPYDLQDHVILHGDNGREWNTWLAAADVVTRRSSVQHFLSDARLSTEAAVRGHGVALGDSITAIDFIARGELVVPFDISVPANNAFYLACRNEARNTAIVSAFVEWMSSTIEEDRPINPQSAASRRIRKKRRDAQN